MISRKELARIPGSPEEALDRFLLFRTSCELRIFVAIASYRDRECQHTVKDLFNKAANPERIFVGICWQFDPKEDEACFEVPYPRPKQVRVVNYSHKMAQGASWARHEAFQLRQHEEYTLSIDAHTRFEENWDGQLLDMLEACASPKAFLTGYPPSYVPPDRLDKGYVTRAGFHRFENDPNGRLPPILHYSSCLIKNEDAPARPFLMATVSNNFLFAVSEAFEQTPFDPYIYFFGDDLTLAARLWTKGWDIYGANRAVIYHLWERASRRGHWDDHKDFGALDSATRLRVAHLVGIAETDDALALKEITKYGLGTARTLEAYQEFAGVNFKDRTIKRHALEGVFSPPCGVPNSS